MMKQQSGQSVAPFTFSDAQREKLMFAWQTKSGLKKAESYIDSVERLVERWLSFADDPKASIPELREYAAGIFESAAALKKAIAAPPADAVMSIKCSMDEQLYGSCHPENAEILDGLRRLFPDTTHPGLIELAEVLDGWLDLLGKSVEKLTDMKGNSSKNKGTEKELLHWLASAYVRHFGKPPSATRESNFRKFVTELSGVLKRQFGEKILSEIIKTTRLRAKKH